MVITKCVAPDLQEGDPAKAICGTRTHDVLEPPRARLRTGRPPRRAAESRLNNAPPPNLIRFFRRRAGLSLQELSNRVGVGRETIRRLEERDTWLDAERATAIGRALSLPKEAIGFSTAPNAYTWAARSLSVAGTITTNDEIIDGPVGRRMAGGSHLPEDSVALDIQQGKMRGWFLVYCPESCEPMTKDVLERQGADETYIACLEDGTTWWRHIKPAARSNFYHLLSRYQDPITDVRIAWVSKVVGIETGLVELPTLEQIRAVVRDKETVGDLA